MKKVIVFIMIEIICLAILFNVSVMATDRGYNHNYNGAGGQVITIDISGNSSNTSNKNTSTNNNSNNNSSVTNSLNNNEASHPSSETQTDASNSNNSTESNSNNSGVSFGSSTSSPSESVTSILQPTNKSNEGETSDSNQNSANPLDLLSDDMIKVLTFSNSIATLKVKSDSLINEGLSLGINKLLLGYDLQNQLGRDSEYFELFLAKGFNEKVDIPEKELNLSIKIDPNKEFLGFYEVVNDDSLKVLNYNKTNDNTLEFETTSLGKYVISYKAEEIINDNQDSSLTSSPTFEQKNNNDTYLWVILGITLVAVLIFIITVVIIFKKYVL